MNSFVFCASNTKSIIQYNLIDVCVDVFQLLIRKHSKNMKAVLQTDAWVNIYVTSSLTVQYICQPSQLAFHVV